MEKVDTTSSRSTESQVPIVLVTSIDSGVSRTNYNNNSGGKPAEKELLLKIVAQNNQNEDADDTEKRLTKRKKLLIFGVATIAVVVAICLVVVLLKSSSSPKMSNYEKFLKERNLVDVVPDDTLEVDSCTTRRCKNAVNEIINSLDTSVDPCENFYEFACRGWQKNNPRPGYTPDWNVYLKLNQKTSKTIAGILQETDPGLPALQQAKSFYASCMTVDDKDDDGVPPRFLNKPNNQDTTNATYQVIMNLLDRNGGWPILFDHGTWKSSAFDLTDTLVSLKKSLASPMFLDISSRQSPLGLDGINLIMINRPSASSSSLINDIVSKEAMLEALKPILALKEFIVNVSKELMDFQGRSSHVNETSLERQAWQIIFVQSEIQQAAKEEIDPFLKFLMGITKNFLVSTKTRLQVVLDAFTHPLDNKIRVGKLLSRLYSPIPPNEDLDTETILVLNADYILSISKLLTELKTEALANYLMFQMILKISPYSTPKIQKLWHDLKRGLESTTGKFRRQQVCVEKTQQKFSIVVGQAYVKKTPFDHFTEVRNIFYGVKQSFTALISGSYLPHLNKTLLSGELKDTELCLGYPEWILDNDKVQSEYNGLSLPGSTFLDDLISVNNWSTRKQLNTLWEQLDRKNKCKWPRAIPTIGAFHEMGRYLVYLPLGMLQDPFFNVDLPNAINYGSLGSVLGHEIIHGLDGPGWSRLSNGSLTPSAKCLVKQYGAFKPDLLKNENMTVNGMLTLNENIPDNAGLLGAYTAFKKHKGNTPIPKALKKYTEEQLFFISFAQNWCHSTSPFGWGQKMASDDHGPGMFRVMGTLQNSKEFTQAWKCGAGSKMNPYQKCSFF